MAHSDVFPQQPVEAKKIAPLRGLVRRLIQ